jgi:hypothetical protein
MSESGNLWKLWLGFNAMFSSGLIFIGFTNLILFGKKVNIATHGRFILLLTIITNAFLVWIGLQYMIAEFAIAMCIPLVLFIAGFTKMHFARPTQYERKIMSHENKE